MGSLIKADFIDRIKEDVNLLDVVRSTGRDLKKRGVNWFCKSPFTDEKTASFCIDDIHQRYKCFSTGKAGGVINFVMDFHNLSFPDAIKWLADFKGFQVEYENQEWAKHAAEKKEKKESLRPLILATWRQYQKQLQALPIDHPAWEEINRRGYDKELVSDWGLGYAPGNGFIYEKFKSQGKVQEGRELGLIGETTDKLWNRVVYPLHDRNGLIVGFSSRDISGKENTAKWMNPPKTPLFDKSKFLFGLNRALREISRTKEVYLVEGYNDVIAWHKHGVVNTVASSGTAITEQQVLILKRYADKVCFTMDGDKAGIAAVLKYIPLFIKHGFSTNVVVLPDGEDPDDFARHYEDFFGLVSLKQMLENPDARKNGFSLLIDHHLNVTDHADKARGVRALAEIVATEKDSIMQNLYMDWLAKEGKVKIGEVRRLVKEIAEVAEEEEIRLGNESQLYQLPKELEGKIRIEDVKSDIEKYGLFQAGNRIWVKQGSEPPYSFKWVSNFSIEIIQHMNDEKFPMKLLRIKNIFNKEKIFDTESDNIMSPQSFQNTVAGHGNFFWKGVRQEHLQLIQMLFDRMGDGEKIDVLGWQKDGFFLFNNLVVFPGSGSQEIDANGVFKVKRDNREVSYYVPSANQVYRNNPYKYQGQKKVVVQGDASLTFRKYTSKMIEVHREHAITGILFSVASMFQDIVVDELSNFPIMFLYGPANTGKDQLIECCQSFFGKPQEAINLEGGASTAKAQLRELAQYSNLMTHLSEYKRGDAKLDGMLKGMWDRRGYKRGTIDSHVSSEAIPVLSSVFLTGNDYPDQDALITRLVWEEMTKQDFSVEEMRLYEQLRDMTKSGISHLTVQILNHRESFGRKFKSSFSRVSKEMKGELAMASKQSRIISNLSVLAATWDVLKDDLDFPFAWHDMINHFRSIVDRQMRKLNTASIGTKWWDCFLAVIRTKQEPMRLNVDFRIEDDLIYFNWTNTYIKIARQWYYQYHENAPSKGKLSDMLSDDRDLGLQKHASYRFDGTRGGVRTSAWSVDLSATGVQDEIMEACDWQRENNLDKPEITTGLGSPSTNSGPSSDSDDELPF